MQLPAWLKTALLVFVASFIGFIIGIFIDTAIPFWLLFGFSLILSLELWFGNTTTGNKAIGFLYRLILNLALLALGGFLVWYGIRVLSVNLPHSQLYGGIIILAGTVLFIWLLRVIAKNIVRWPGMLFTIFLIVVVCLGFAFAGVQPLVQYKDTTFSFIREVYQDYFVSGGGNLSPTGNTTTTSKTSITTVTSSPPSTALTGISRSTGTYLNYSLGLVYDPDGVVSGNKCYGEFIVLINNKNAKDPTYQELLNFLQKDTTDEFAYQFTPAIGGFYYGDAEDQIDLLFVEDIIDGNKTPLNPKVCSDFAERVHNNAEIAGIKCGYVTIDFSEGPGHACNVFNTTDRGLVYIDCTGGMIFHPDNCDKIVNLSIGQAYIPQSLFPETGWSSTWDNLGIVTDTYMTWDGYWRN
jgi:hypothetical protein